MIPSDLLAVPGDKILPKYKRLLSYIDAQQLVPINERLKINLTNNGTHVTILDDNTGAFAHPLKITLRGLDEYTVKEGYLNNTEAQLITKERKLKFVTSPEAVGFIPEDKGNSGTYFWVYTQLQQGDTIIASYIECMDSILMRDQLIVPEEFVLGGPHLPPRKVVNVPDGDREFYIPLAFMRGDRKIHQFTMHNVYLRPYKVGINHRIIFWPG
jgi:hypothetical protein